MSDERKCRQAIIRLKLKPLVHDGVWNGYSWIGPDDQDHCGGLPDNIFAQMRLMVEEGYWGNVRVDTNDRLAQFVRRIEQLHESRLSSTKRRPDEE